MQYAYFLEVQKYEERNNQKVFQIIKELELPEEQVFCDDNPDDRTELKNLIDILEEDDLLIIRSVKDITEDITPLYKELFPLLDSKGVELFSCEEPYLCGTDYKRTLNNFILLMDYFYVKRKKSGYQKALDEGRVGRPAKTESVEKAIKLYESNLYTIAQIESLTGVSKSTLYKYLKEECE